MIWLTAAFRTFGVFAFSILYTYHINEVTWADGRDNAVCAVDLQALRLGVH